MIDSDIIHKEFTLVINEEWNYYRLKERIRIKEDQLTNIEQNGLIELDQSTGKSETLKSNNWPVRP